MRDSWTRRLARYLGYEPAATQSGQHKPRWVNIEDPTLRDLADMGYIFGVRLQLRARWNYVGPWRLAGGVWRRKIAGGGGVSVREVPLNPTEETSLEVPTWPGEMDRPTA